MSTVSATYYDGQSAKRNAVTLGVQQGHFIVQGEEVSREEVYADTRIAEKLGSSPRLLHFASGGHCEISDHAAFEAMLREAGYAPRSLVSRLEGGWRYALAAMLLCFAFAAATYYWGLPWVAEFAANRIPYRTAHAIDVQALQALDEEKMLQPSHLSAKRKQSLQRKFDALKKGRDLPAYPLEFRNSKSIGANAFALPGGTVVVTDELIDLASNDQEILAVLAHELGHVSERHPLRQMLQSSVVALAMGWYFGDVSSLLAAAPTLLLQTSYSRDFERRADHYAAAMLRANGMSPTRLADMLAKLEASQHHAAGGKKNESSILELMSTHPETEKRIRMLRESDGGVH